MAPTPVSGDATEVATEVEGDEAARTSAPRERVGEGRCVGLVVEWRGYMGWIQPLMRIKHVMAQKHQGRVYLNLKDVATVGDRKEKVKEGRIVDFLVYADSTGLGAEECRPRHAIRMTVPHREANRMLKQSSQWSEYLTDSEYYPTFEREHGVLLRKYAWELNFAVLELWGHFDELAAAAVCLAKQGHEEAKKIADEKKKKAIADGGSEEKATDDTAEEEDASKSHLRLLLFDSEVSKVEEAIPNCKVSAQPVVPFPLNCHTLTIEAGDEEAKEDVKKFVMTLAGPAPEEQEAKSPPKGKGKGKSKHTPAYHQEAYYPQYYPTAKGGYGGYDASAGSGGYSGSGYEYPTPGQGSSKGKGKDKDKGAGKKGGQESKGKGKSSGEEKKGKGKSSSKAEGSPAAKGKGNEATTKYKWKVKEVAA